MIDDIFSSYIDSEARKSKPQRSQSSIGNQNQKNEGKDPFSIMRKGADLTTEDTFSNKTTGASRATTGFGNTSNVIKKNPRTPKSDDPEHDILALIEQELPKAHKTQSAKVNQQQSTPNRGQMNALNNDLDNLIAGDDDFDFDKGGYIPSVRSNTAGSTNMTDEQKNKRKKLFGMGGTADTSVDNKSTTAGDSNMMGTMKQRPLTSENQPSLGQENSDVPQINITGVSRRNKRANTQQVSQPAGVRPLTSPGVLNKPEIGNIDDGRSLKSQTDLGGGATPFNNLDDDDLASQSEYFSQAANRQARGAGGLGVDKKPPVNPVVSGHSRLRIDVASDAGRDVTPKRSPASTQGEFMGGFNPEEPRAVTAYSKLQNTGAEATNEADVVPNLDRVSRRSRRNQDSKKEEAQSQKTLDDGGSTLGIQTSKYTPQNTQFDSISPTMEPNKQLVQTQKIPLMNNDAALKTYLEETEEHYKKRAKETEDHYKQRYESLKTQLDDERKKLDEAHKREIDLIKREKDNIKDSMNEQMKLERERLEEFYKREAETKEKLHKYELEQQKHVFEEQGESLKRQLEAQSRLNSLADEIKMSSAKINALSNKFEHEKSNEDIGKKGELFEKERALQERELKLNHEKEMFEAEKAKVEKRLQMLDKKELELQKNQEKERDLIKDEYRRLNDLQEQIRQSEQDKKRDFEFEKKNVENKKIEIERENQSLKEDYRRRYNELELQIQLFEQRKQENEDILQKSETSLRDKHAEVDDIRKRLTIQESDFLRRYKTLEQKELIMSKQADELDTKAELFQMDRQGFEREKLQITELASKTREQSEVINKFKRDFDSEKEKNRRLKAELDSMQFKISREKQEIEHERSTLQKLQKNIEGLRYGFVKEYAATAQNFYQPTNQTEESMIGQPLKDTFGYPPASMPKKSSSTYGLLAQEENQSYINNDTNYQTGKSLTRGGLSEQKLNILNEDNKGIAPSTQYKKPTTPKSKISNSPELHDSNRLVTAKPFNLKSYMSQLRQFDRTSNNNQAYITHEKEDLIKTKLDFTSTKGRGSGSPRFKLNLLPETIEH